jgi:hypothetical protein
VNLIGEVIIVGQFPRLKLLNPVQQERMIQPVLTGDPLQAPFT